jgi:hypothetical protein
MLFLLFLLDDGRIRIPISAQWIRMRIREAQKHMDPNPTDPDLQHWLILIGEHWWWEKQTCRALCGWILAEVLQLLVDPLQRHASQSHNSETAAELYKHLSCGSGSGIRCLFDPWIWEPGWVKNQVPDPGSGSEKNNPDHISESLRTIFWVKILKFFDVDSG